MWWLNKRGAIAVDIAILVALPWAHWRIADIAIAIAARQRALVAGD